jgi:hypothetical protein
MLLRFFLLVVLVEGEPGAANGDGCGHLLLHRVRPSVLRVLLRLVLLVLHVSRPVPNVKKLELTVYMLVLLG